MSGRKILNLDGRRPAIGGIRGWTEVPALLIPGQEQVFGIHEDCQHATESDTPAGVGHVPPGWTVDMLNSTMGIADVIGGVWQLVMADAANNWIQATLGDAVRGAFCPMDNKQIWFEVRVKQSVGLALDAEVDMINIGFGLIDPQAAIIMADDGTGPSATDYIMFYTVEAAAPQTWVFASRNQAGGGGAATTHNLTLVPEERVWHTFGFVVSEDHYMKGDNRIFVYVDRVHVYTMTVAADIPNAVMLMPFVALTSGHAEVQTLFIDWVMCLQDRWPTATEPVLA